MKVMNYSEINRLYTEQVASLLAQGYRFNTGTMNGSQGEIAHVDLTNGSEIKRVLIERYSAQNEDRHRLWYMTIDALRIVVGRVKPEENVAPDNREDWCKIWNDRLDVCSEIKYGILFNKNGPVYVSLEEGFEAMQKHLNRHEARNYWWKTDLEDPKWKKAILPWLRKQRDLKTVKESDIDVSRHDAGVGNKTDSYIEIQARGKTFTIAGGRVRRVR